MRTMRKHLILTLALALLLVMAFGIVGSGAWFTDTDDSTNTFTAGTLSVVLGGTHGNGITITAPLDSVAPINEIGGMAPGVEFGPYTVNVVNEQNPQSTLAAKYRLTAEKLTGSDAFFEKLNVRVETGFCPLDDGNDYNMYVGPLDEFEVHSNALASPGQINYPISKKNGTGSGLINPQNTHCFQFFFELDESAGNDIQGQTMSFKLKMDATQAANPGWTE